MAEVENLVPVLVWALVIVAVALIAALPLLVWMVLRHVERTQVAGGTPVHVLTQDRELSFQAQEREQARAHEYRTQRLAHAGRDVAAKAMGD